MTTGLATDPGSPPHIPRGTSFIRQRHPWTKADLEFETEWFGSTPTSAFPTPTVMEGPRFRHFPPRCPEALRKNLGRFYFRVNPIYGKILGMTREDVIRELIEEAKTCRRCGKVHVWTQHQNWGTWADQEDGHAYYANSRDAAAWLQEQLP